MKKRMSSAALGLQLTFWPVMAAIAMCSAFQLWSFFRTEYLWEMDGYVNYLTFEELLDNHRVAYHGKSSFLLILGMILIAPKNKACYTLQRLRISENELTAQWALLFAGYFLLSWAVQLGLCMVLFRIYANAVGLKAMDFFLASYRSRYLHLLLPLGENWGYGRNVLLCLGWGTMGALTGRYLRHGGKPFMAIALVIGTLMFLPSDMASEPGDIILSVVLVLAAAIQLYLIREVERNED